MSTEELPSDSLAIVDTSVIYAMGGPSNEKYQAFEKYVTRRNISVRIPDHVAEELGESPDAYHYQRDRLRSAQDAGWLERAEVDFTDPDVSDAIDRTRERIYSLSADDVTEDEIETTDAVLAGLAYQYATKKTGHVAILVSDTLAEQAIADVLAAMGVGEEISVIEGRIFLGELLDTQFD
ncbi:hypothetical protein GJ629_03440 [Halapricum sp. CBA1109]|uniref:hypothetical protein n=1 Tax=Halapricum sp. CBA1109 TaxID=2668068 RepID=UPI0012F9402A|nr:hypothetical protein [Halapricum sp. CBA1109]MUV89069.1 hypothetical protein [Halapricum sp. CBA1109]